MSDTTLFLGGRVSLYAGDCREVLREFPDNHFDSIVTDPPYALVSIGKRFGATALTDETGTSDRSRKGADGYARLAKGFMGKSWDTGEAAFAVEFWREALRVLKPGGFVVAFGGTRTYHRLAVAIEDAGFEIRDRIEFDHETEIEYSLFERSLNDEQRGQFEKLFRERGVGSLAFRYGTGFPKSHNINKSAAKKICQCGAEAFRKRVVRPMRTDGLSAPERIGEECKKILLDGVSQQSASVAGWPQSTENDGRGQSRVEGRRHISETPGELREREIRSLSPGTGDDGADGRLRDGASPCDGEMDRPPADANRVRSSQGPRAAEQPEVEFGALAGQPKSQERGAWDNCERCGKPIIPDGLGSALKPAYEPICIARKPLSESTVAANVLRWGTGALNIDATRVETNPAVDDPRLGGKGDWSSDKMARNVYGDGYAGVRVGSSALGRWPANLLHDGSPEVVAAFPDNLTSGTGAVKKQTSEGWQGSAYGKESRAPGTPNVEYGDTGSAARFFASFPQKDEPRCALCGLLSEPLSDTKQTCDAINAALSFPTQSTEAGASVPENAADSPARENVDRSNPPSSHAPDAESSLLGCLRQNASSVRQSAPPPPLSKIVQNVRSAADLCDSCATAIAQSLAATRLGQDPASHPLPGSISARSALILKRNFALYVDGRENTDTILTIPNLKTFFGSVFHAIASNTESEASPKDAPTKFGKRFHYDSKADADDRIGSKHPTVKPVDLMQWLVRLVTPPGGLCLDPFAGSGTTGEAALREGFSAVLIEREAEYQADVARRMEHAVASQRQRRETIVKERNRPAAPAPLFDFPPEAAE